MKYELMRACYCSERQSFMLDLYNMHYNKGVELHYYMRNKKYDIESIKDVLEHKRRARERHSIEYWDSLITVKKGEENGNR